MTATVTVTRALDYGLGEVLDIYRPDTGGGFPVVLLWHGVGVAERDVFEPLARAVAAGGAVVVVPDWRSTAPDRGRAHLLGSLAFTRARASGYAGDVSKVVLAGWSRGARAGFALSVHPELVEGWRPAAFVGIAGGYGPRPDGRNPAAPTTGTLPLDDARTSVHPPLPVWLVHGTADPTVDVEESRRLTATLRARGWDVQYDEVPGADHVSIVSPRHRVDGVADGREDAGEGLPSVAAEVATEVAGHSVRTARVLLNAVRSLSPPR
ncbi:chlorophyllase/cutinase-like alpha/beta fold protein [Actinopolymorpha alba]|uniref:prolyl oligopeptidase family serine peptidase n=1 Tax=Actinopolymorpha alba TaxID=533267 RepID=UPI00035E2841|nr:prolyl oligopeptidase family serine peptidase [Actinopolymorpha alba]